MHTKIKTKKKMTINAKNSFKEGWIMLHQPFEFGELSKPIQMKTVLYAYSERPLFDIELTPEGREILDHAAEVFNYASPFSGGAELVGGYRWGKYIGEDQDKYEDRFVSQYDEITKQHCIVEVHKGNAVQCFIEKQTARFYPKEYSVLSRESFETVLNSDDYFFMVENEEAFNYKHIQDKVHYLKSRGVPKHLAERFSSAEMKDNVWFKPKPPILSMFARDHEIYLPDPDYTKYFEGYGMECPKSFSAFFAEHGIEVVEEMIL